MGFWILAGVLLLAALIVLEVFRCSRVRFRRLQISLPPEAMGGESRVSILHISDLHTTAATARRLEQLSFLLQGRWDFVLASGDLIDDNSGARPVCDFISRLQSVHGTYAVLGNHDYFHIPHCGLLKWIRIFTSVAVLGRQERFYVPNDVQTLSDSVESSGIKLMINQVESGKFPGGDRFQVFGIDDPSTERDKPEELYGEVDRDALRLVITHSPKRIGLLAPLAPSLVLCGHTHAGQLRLPLLGAFTTHSDAGRRACSGLVEMDGLRVHISPGFGAGRFFPWRFMARCEVTEITLIAADREK